MLEKDLVSIISPCYNVGGVIHRFLTSIVNQSYSNIELILVDDGSTDNTGDVIKSYINSFEQKGIKVKYIYQENKGLGGAINTGLKHFTGEYLCWPDSDDYLSPDSVERKVFFLKNNQQYKLVRSDAAVYDEKDLDTIINYITYKKTNRFRDSGLFDDYIRRKDVIFCSGCHMVRSSAFLEVNPKRHIYPARRGQNYQMLLPLLYKYKFGYIDEVLYNYIIYKNSMSRGDDTLEKVLNRNIEIEEIILKTLDEIPLTNEEKLYYTNMTKETTNEYKFEAAYKYSNRKELNEAYRSLPFNYRRFVKRMFVNIKTITF